MKRKSKTSAAVLAAAVMAGILIGLLAASIPEVKEKIQELPAMTESYTVDNRGFEPADVSILGNTVTIQSGCRAVSFDVTDDQAFSISHAARGETPVRPLSHDIMVDVFENYNFTVLTIRIEKFDNDIYYGRMFLQQGAKVLDMDMRPSDSIAIALRTGNTLYINSTMLDEKGTDAC